MSVHEIVQMYKEAKDKNAQIEILADMNTCSKDDILMILQNEGLISGVKKTKAAEKRTKRGAPQTLAFEGEEEDGRSVTELSERGKRPGAQPRMTRSEEAKEQVRKLLEEGLTVLEVAERMGLDVTQVRNAVTRYKLKKANAKMQNIEATPHQSATLTASPQGEARESAEDKIEPLGVVSLIRDYAKCITSLPSADIRNYEKIVRTFAESIIEGADRILEEGAKYGA